VLENTLTVLLKYEADVARARRVLRGARGDAGSSTRDRGADAGSASRWDS